MWDLVKGVATVFKTRKVNTDSTIFKLHYQVTFCLMLIFTLILAANQYVGKPIKCMHHMNEESDEVLDTYCWIHSTYTVTSAFYKEVGIEVAFPGVDSTRGNKEDVKVYRFYQWVSFCLVFQNLRKFDRYLSTIMWDLVKGVATVFKTQKVNTDSTIFKLHYQITFCLILIFTLILAANQYVGNPIKCMHHMGGKSDKPSPTDEVLDTYCWIHMTYTVTSAFYKEAGIEVAFPGVDSTKGNKEDVKVYRFYQWVSFCLAFQLQGLDLTVRTLYSSRINAAEMEFMRRTAGVTKWDHKRNDEILKELTTEPILQSVNSQKGKTEKIISEEWIEHASRSKSCSVLLVEEDPLVARLTDGLMRDRNRPPGLKHILNDDDY
ncbi:hypothetical protein ANN_25546 [Periplaneta americana]|uniref:Innexin n=1 Tax=Periplaneta americana TaxID=6978 RepID=A0ABQ8S1K6_PERAM|nr:hypothetical protein ANN_25546 [Periplaneta americana]